MKDPKENSKFMSNRIGSSSNRLNTNFLSDQSSTLSNGNNKNQRRPSRDITFKSGFFGTTQDMKNVLPNLSQHHSQRTLILKGTQKSKPSRDNINVDFTHQSRLDSARLEQALRSKMHPEMTSETEISTFIKYKQEFKNLKQMGQLLDEDARKFRKHEFITEKKRKNKVKYTQFGLINHKTIPIPKGSTSIMLNIGQPGGIKYQHLDLNKNIEKTNPKSRCKLKWKTIQNLIFYKPDIVNYTIKNYVNIYLEFGKGLKGNFRLAKHQFHRLLCFAGLTKTEDWETTDKLMYSFDDEN